VIIDPLILVRSVHFAATVLAAGTVCFLALVAEPAARAVRVDLSPLRRRLALLTWAALAVAILSGAGWLLLLAADIYGTPILEVGLHCGAWQVATETRFGVVGSVRAALALLLGLLVLWPSMRLAQLAAATLLIALLGWIGHAGATPGPLGRLHLAADVAHLLSAGAWLGGLPALAMLLAQARHAADPAWRAFTVAATRRFSLLGIVCVGALLASGAINSWNLLAGPRDLVATDYGQLILIKIGLFAAMVAIATVNRFQLTPRLPAPAAMRALRRNSLAESGLGAAALAIVGLLGTLDPAAHVHAPSTEIPLDTAFVHIHTDVTIADLTIEPGHPGRVNATIRIAREDSSEFAVKQVTLALDPPAASVKSVEHAAMRRPDGTWHVDGLEIRQPGIWTARVIVVPESGPPIVLDAPVVIER
jgi:putative copper resistance protein D